MKSCTQCARMFFLLTSFSVIIQNPTATKFNSFTSSERLYHVGVHGDAVYVGGANVLLHLSQNLTLNQSLSLGPVYDSSNCDPQLTPCEPGDVSLVSENNVKVLEVSERKGRLLVCGSARLGICQLHSLMNISEYMSAFNVSHADYVASQKSVAVLFNKHDFDDDILFVGQEYDGRSFAYSPSVISSRKLDYLSSSFEINFMFVDYTISVISALDINEKLKGDFHMEFVDILQSDKYVYFVTLQQRSVEDSNTLYPRIGRICFQPGRNIDVSYTSYVELGFLCRGVTREYSRILAVTMQGGFIFFSAVSVYPDSFGANVDGGSAICGISLSSLNNFFAQAVYECFRRFPEDSMQRLAWLRGVDSQHCTLDSVMLSFYCVVFVPLRFLGFK